MRHWLAMGLFRDITNRTSILVPSPSCNSTVSTYSNVSVFPKRFPGIIDARAFSSPNIIMPPFFTKYYVGYVEVYWCAVHLPIYFLYHAHDAQSCRDTFECKGTRNIGRCRSFDPTQVFYAVIFICCPTTTRR